MQTFENMAVNRLISLLEFNQLLTSYEMGLRTGKGVSKAVSPITNIKTIFQNRLK